MKGQIRKGGGKQKTNDKKKNGDDKKWFVCICSALYFTKLRLNTGQKNKTQTNFLSFDVYKTIFQYSALRPAEDSLSHIHSIE